MVEDQRRIEEQASLVPENDLPELFRALVLQSPISTWIADPDGTLLFENAANKQRFGIERDEEVVGKYNIFKDEEITRQGLAPQIRQVFEQGGSTEFVIDYDFSRVSHVHVAHPTHKILRAFLFAITDKAGKVHYVVVQHEDFTEKFRAQKALADSEARYRDLLENISEWLWETDAEGQFTYANPVVKRVLGYSPKDIVGKSVFELIIPEDHEHVRAKLEEAIAHKTEIHGLINRMRHRDGSIRVIETSSKPICDDEGRIIGFRGVDRDITERIEAEEALRQSEEQYKLLFHSNPLPMLVYDLETLRFLEVNRAMVEHYGYTHDEFLSMSIKDIRPPEDVSGLLGIIAKKTSGLDIVPGVWRHLKKDGTIIDVEIVAHTITWEGRPAEIVLVYDVTEKMRAQEALRESEANYRSIFNAANDVIFVHDAETGDIIDVNDKVYEMYGYTPDEARGMSVVSFSAAEPSFGDGKALRAIRKAAEGEPQLFEWKGRDKTGRVFWEEVNLKKAVIGDQVRVLAVVRDITERKLTEEKLKYSLSFQQVITNLATRFINLPSNDIDNGIKEALKVTSEFIGADRSFVFLIEPNGEFFSNTHEWHAEGIESRIERLQQLRMSDFRFVREAEPLLSPLIIPNVEDLPSEYAEEKHALQAQKVKSFVGLPMIRKARPLGFLGFVTVHEERTWPEESITLLRILGEIFVNALERKQTEEALRASEEKFRSLHEMAPIAIVLNRLDNGQFLESNRMLQDMLGYTEDEIRNLSYFDVTPTEYAEAESRQLELLRTVGRYGPYEKEYIRKDGTRIPVLLNGVRLFAPDGTPLIYSTIQDITERKKAEESLRLTQFAMDHSAIANYWITPNARIVYANELAAKTLGYSREELSQMSVHDVDVDFPPQAWPDHWKELKERGSLALESLHRTKDGRVFPVEIIANYIQFAGKEYNIAFTRDITERKLEEERRAELEEHKREFYRRTIVAATEGTLVITERDEIKERAGTPIYIWNIEHGEDLSRIRQAVTQVVDAEGMEEDRIYDFILAIGEATTNAYKHAGGGLTSLHRVDDSFICVVSDKGPGIEALVLPEVALARGYSTAGSLGMGYKAIISIADKVYLATGPDGTTVAIEMGIKPPEKPLAPVGIPDTWET